MSVWDVIVIGVGGVGSAACYHLARRGARVLGIDRWSPPHDHGSSHGATRIIRRAYFEHPNYVPLVNRAYEWWEELESETAISLLSTCGLLQIGPPDGQVIPGVLASVRTHGLDAEQWDADEIRHRMPLFQVGDDQVAVWEPGAGYLRVERCVAAHWTAAARLGAALRPGVTVRQLANRGGDVVVTSDEGEYVAPAVILTPGPWAPAWLGTESVTLRVLQKQLHWLEPPPAAHERAGFSTFLVETDDGVFYGFPAIDDQGVKVAEHTGGREVSSPDAAPASEDEQDTRRVRRFVEQTLPSIGFHRCRHARCYYTMTEDEHFVLDRHPTLHGVWLAAGFSGHGFKFAPTMGEALADFALTGRTDLPVDFLARDGRH